MLFSKKTHDRKIRSRAFPNAGRKRQNGKEPIKPVLDFQSATHATPRHGPNEFDSAPGPQSVFYKAGKPETGRYGPAAEPLSKIGTYRIPYARNGKQKKTVKEKRTFRKTTKVRKWFRTFVFHKAPVVRHRFSH